MSKKKMFYAVRIGRRVGVYDNWEQTKAMVNKFPNAEYKGFATEDKAIEYLGDDALKMAINREIFIKDYNKAYVAGSYNANTKFAAGGCVFYDNFGTIHTLSRVCPSRKSQEAHNVLGEIEGVKLAIETAYTLSIPNLSIYYQFEGIAKWATEEWMCKSPLASEYAKFIKDATKLMNITFVKNETEVKPDEFLEAYNLARIALDLDAKTE